MSKSELIDDLKTCYFCCAAHAWEHNENRCNCKVRPCDYAISSLEEVVAFLMEIIENECSNSL